MLYAQIFQSTTEPWEVYVRRALNLLLTGVSTMTSEQLAASSE